jgi:hypothetical protein
MSKKLKLTKSDLTPGLAQEYLDQYGSLTKAAAALKISRSFFTKILRKGMPKVKTKAEPTGKTLQDFKQLYDVDQKAVNTIKATLKKLGNDLWMYEADFIRECKVSPLKVAAYREMFIDYIVFLRKERRRVWCGSTKFAEQLREIGQ